MSKTNTNTNIFGLIKKGEYKYKYIWGDKQGPIRIQIFANLNTNIRHTLHWVTTHLGLLRQGPGRLEDKEVQDEEDSKGDLTKGFSQEDVRGIVSE